MNDFVPLQERAVIARKYFRVSNGLGSPLSIFKALTVANGTNPLGRESFSYENSSQKMETSNELA